MVKIKNKAIHSDDREFLKRIAEELQMLGRHYRLDLKNGVLIQLALPPRRRKKDDEKHKGRRS